MAPARPSPESGHGISLVLGLGITEVRGNVVSRLSALQKHWPGNPKLRLGRIAAAVVAVSGLHHKIFLRGCQMDLTVARCGVSLVGRIAQAVLVAQLFFNAGVDLIDRLLLGNFKEAAASLP